MSDEDSSLMIRVMVKTAEYLEYIKDHYNKVQQAWNDVKEACRDEIFISDDYRFNIIDRQIKDHDRSKLSQEEFVPYRKQFFPAEGEIKDLPEVFDAAWEHHKERNSHHWETWTARKEYPPYYPEISCVHMVVDWIAMADARNNPIDKYYNENKDEIKIPEWAHKLVQDILTRVAEYRMEEKSHE